jgi:hypothetical protein
VDALVLADAKTDASGSNKRYSVTSIPGSVNAGHGRPGARRERCHTSRSNTSPTHTVSLDMYIPQRVTICTVHAAKGLEWPVVFVPAGKLSLMVFSSLFLTVRLNSGERGLSLHKIYRRGSGE